MVRMQKKAGKGSANNNKEKSLESWIWDAACSIRGAKDAPKYKDYILPLIFTKRLCDVFDDEINLIEAISTKRLGLDDVEADIVGKSYEYLIRKFAEGGGQSAGEFYTPPEVGIICAPRPRPRAGHGDLRSLLRLRRSADQVRDRDGGKGGGTFLSPIFEKGGQECPHSFEALRPGIHRRHLGHGQHEPDHPRFRGRDRDWRYLQEPKVPPGGQTPHLRPCRRQSHVEPELVHRGRLRRRRARALSRQGRLPRQILRRLGLGQHMHASLNDKGRAAVVLDTGAASRGSGNAGTNKEKTVRQWFVDHDLIESVLYLPENLFYNTTAPGIVLFLNKAKPKARQGKVLLVNASQIFEKGDPKNFIPPEGIARIADTLLGWKEEEKLSRIVDHAELKKNDYNISPSRYIHTSDAETYRPIAEIVDELDVIEAEARETDKALRANLEKIGV